MRSFVRCMAFKAAALLCRNVGPKIVYYHDMGKNHTSMGTDAKLLKAHVAAALDEGFVFAGEIMQLKERRLLHICFDDGFRGILEHAEWFASEGIRPTVFIPVGLVGQPGYLAWHEIAELQRLGFNFEGHTWTHRPLTEVPVSEWHHELHDSKCCLEDKLGRPVSCLCYPCGFFSDRAIAAVCEAGYCYQIGSYPGCVDLNEELVPRHLVQSLSVVEYRLVLQGALLPFRRRYIRQHFRQ